MCGQTEASTAGVTMPLFLFDPVGAALLCADQEIALPPGPALPSPAARAGSAAANGPRLLHLVSGRYLLQERVGRGSSGVVFRAQDRWLARQVAVKVFTAPGSAGEERRAEREAVVLARLHHPGLVGVLDCGSDRGNRFVVLEFVDGRPLDSVVDGEALPEAEAVRIAAGVADTLAYVHARGIVHRDVKPANILIDRSGRPKLGDFGVARAYGGSEALTATGCIVGTPRYMAPEQVRGEPLTGAVDVYALGLVLLECLTGSPEYTGAGLECAVA
ncbi:MAG TPA: serine/threonine-protein kinase, partial [Kineosporiaceae bacterium]|nr:serine/threonine-protein kinase [Kineosporiaceae bacterium]